MKKGVIIDIKDQYTYVLCKNAHIKRIHREYYHEVGQEIDIPFFTLKRVIPMLVTACLIILVVIMNPLQNQQTVKALSYVSLSVNPGLMFKIDNQQRVVAISYTNKEGEEMIKQIDFMNQSLDDCVILFIDYCFENHYFQNTQNIDINVISDNQEQIQSLEAQINQTIQDYLKTHQVTISISVDKVSSAQHQDAQNLGIPDSKIKLIDLILQYYPNLDKETLAREDVDDLIEYLEDKGYDEDVLDKLEDDLESKENEDDDNDDEDEEDDDDEDDEDDD